MQSDSDDEDTCCTGKLVPSNLLERDLDCVSRPKLNAPRSLAIKLAVIICN